MSKENIDRNKAIIDMRKEGKTLRSIATKFGISRGRVWQILGKAQRKKTKAG